MRPRIAELAAALAAAKLEFPPIKKTQTAQAGTFNYDYAGLPEINAAVDPVLSKHGLVTIHQCETRDGMVYLRSRLVHRTGEEIGSELPLFACDVSGSWQARGSVLTYARRYAKCGLLDIAAEDDDAQGANDEFSPPGTPKRSTSGRAPSKGASTTPPKAAPPAPTSSSSTRNFSPSISPEQNKQLGDIAIDAVERLGVPEESVRNFVRLKLSELGLQRTDELTKKTYDALCRQLQELRLTDLVPKASRGEADAPPHDAANPFD